MTHLSLTISGMSCNHCVGAVTKALKALPGVDIEQVGIGTSTVNFDERATSQAQITLALQDEGYPVLTIK